MPEVAYEELRDHLAECSDGEALLADGFEPALVGTMSGWFGNSHRTLALYDLPRCMEILIDQGMDEDEAAEWLEVNVCGAYVGPSTPLFGVIHRPPIIIQPPQQT
jgi:hypothetical protein